MKNKKIGNNIEQKLSSEVFPFLQKRQDRLCGYNLKSLYVQRHILLKKSRLFFGVLKND